MDIPKSLLSRVTLSFKRSPGNLEFVSDSTAPRQKLPRFTNVLRNQFHVMMLSRNKKLVCSLVYVRGLSRNTKSLFSLGHLIGHDELLAGT